jgi:hypothetical protein
MKYKDLKINKKMKVINLMLSDNRLTFTTIKLAIIHKKSVFIKQKLLIGNNNFLTCKIKTHISNNKLTVMSMK